MLARLAWMIAMLHRGGFTRAQFIDRFGVVQRTFMRDLAAKDPRGKAAGLTFAAAVIQVAGHLLAELARDARSAESLR